MTDTKDEIFEFLQIHTTDIELVKDESRLENRINEVKTDLKGDIMQVRTDLLQVKTDLENNIREVKTDLENNIREVKTDLLQVKSDLENNIREVKTDLENDIQIVRDDIKDRISGLRWFIGTTVAIAAVIVPLISKYL